MLTAIVGCRLDEGAQILIIGTSKGYVQLHSGSGTQITRQRIHTTSITNISIRGSHQGLAADDRSEEVAVGFKGGVARLLAVEVNVVGPL